MLRRMMGIDQIFFCQKNVLDLENRKLEITAWNESFDNRVTVEEKCIYYAEGNRTKFSQSAKLKIHSFWGLESTVEKLMITHYKVNRIQSVVQIRESQNFAKFRERREFSLISKVLVIIFQNVFYLVLKLTFKPKS